MTQSTVHVTLDSFNFTCTAEEIAATFAWLLEEMRAAVPRLRNDERTVLRQIMSHESGAFTVRDLFPNFQREREAHKTLRRLRAAQFIRPGNTGRWEENEPIEIKPFGRLVWDQLGETAIFGVPPQQNPAPDEDAIDLSRPDVHEPDEAETVRAKRNDAVTWDDDAVLDILNDRTDG